MTVEALHPRRVAAFGPDHIAFIVHETKESLTYAQLVARADRAARLFASLGVQEGDTVAFLSENALHYPELVWAAKNSGLHYVAISTHLSAEDVAYILANSNTALLVVSAAMADIACEALARTSAKMPVVCIGSESHPDFLPYETLLRRQPGSPLPHRRRGASMLYSSGTTGRPKGVRTELIDVPPETPPTRQAALNVMYALGADTILFNPGPLYHAAPLRLMMAVQRVGGTVVCAKKFDAEGALNAIAQHRATHGFFVPTMFIRMLRLPAAVREGVDLSSMRFAIHGAAPCPREVKHAMIAWWGPVIEELYGGTEGAGQTFISTPEWLVHEGSVGRPAPGCKIKIVDQAGVELPANTPGRIFMTNGRSFSYYGDPEKTASAHDAEGYACLGDIGYLDTDGYLYLTDREAHMIISGGVNIYPQEAENVLAAHPMVHDVAVIGIPHDEFGEEVRALVVPSADCGDRTALAAELIALCRNRLGSIKSPRSVDFFTDLPRNELGKLEKRRLKDLYWAQVSRRI